MQRPPPPHAAKYTLNTHRHTCTSYTFNQLVKGGPVRVILMIDGQTPAISTRIFVTIYRTALYLCGLKLNEILWPARLMKRISYFVYAIKSNLKLN